MPADPSRLSFLAAKTWMRSVGVGLLLGLGSSMGAQTPAAAPGADFSGVTRFFEVVRVLEGDKEPSPEQWDALFSTPGYQTLRREFDPDFFKTRFRLAFMPSRAAALQEQMKREKGFEAQFLPHYLRVKAMGAQLQRQMAELKPEALYAKAIARAHELLPAGTPTGTPAVSFVIFAPDARGYEPVVMDLLFTLDLGGRLEDVIAHEFYHYYRRRMVDVQQDQATLWVLDQIHNEGVADLLDKAPWLTLPDAQLDAPQKAYVKLVHDTPAVIRKMDELLARMATLRNGRAALGRELKKAVPQSGHPTGLFMATAIRDTLGQAALVKTTDDPFAFFRLFQEVAERKGGDFPRFSPKAMGFLERLAATHR